MKWYDYYKLKIEDCKLTEIYDCPWLRMLQEYNVMPLDSISYAIYIIPRFHKKNQFLMNR